MAKKKVVAHVDEKEVIEKDACVIAQDAIIPYDVEQDKVDYSLHPKFNKFINNKGEKHDK